MNKKTIQKALGVIEDGRVSGDLVTVTEAAALLGVTRSAVSQLATAGLVETLTPAPIPRLVTRKSVELYKAHRDARDKAGRYESGNEPPRYENA
jgi:hypothetical protein